MDAAPLVERILNDEGLTSDLDEAAATLLLQELTTRARKISGRGKRFADRSARETEDLCRSARDVVRRVHGDAASRGITGVRSTPVVAPTWPANDSGAKDGPHQIHPRRSSAGSSDARSGRGPRRAASAATSGCSSPSSPGAAESPGRREYDVLRAVWNILRDRRPDSHDVAPASRTTTPGPGPSASTSPARTSRRTSPGDIAHTLAEYIDKTERTLDVAAFELDNQVITDALRPGRPAAASGSGS